MTSSGLNIPVFIALFAICALFPDPAAALLAAISLAHYLNNQQRPAG